MANGVSDEKCLLCFSTIPQPGVDGDTYDIDCPCCGPFSLTDTADRALGSDNDPCRRRLAYWVNNQNTLGLSPRIDSAIAEAALNLKSPSADQRAQLYLGAVVRAMDGQLHGDFDQAEARFQIASWSSPQDTVALARYWIGKKALVQPTFAPGRIYAGVETRIAYDELTGVKATSTQAFVAMSFSEELRPAYDLGIAPAVFNAGYTPLRVDRKEHDGKIDDLIIAEIRRSGFTIADLTGHRAGVYYEAGFAHGLGQRVIFTCHADALNETHFDIRQYNMLLWREPNDLKRLLLNRVLALFGAGAGKPEATPV